MSSKIKLKIRNPKDGHQRTNTDYMEPRKPNILTNKTLTMVNKKTINLSQQGQIKKQKAPSNGHTKYSNKSSITMSKLATQTYEKVRIPIQHKLGIDKIFNKLKTKDTNKETNSNKIKTQVSAKKRQKSVLDDKQKYEIITEAGSGTFGVVYKARNKKTLEMVAIKKVFQDKKYKNRELQILKLLKHPNVLEMVDSFFTYEKDKQYLNVVMDYYPLNLQQYIIEQKRNGGISHLKMKVLVYQMFRGLLYLEHLSIAHRDIKPHNILVKPDCWKLSICDFGSAKQLVQGEPNISYICSRCYRAPQLIFGNTKYSPQIDVWSAGCIIIEMITGVPMFRANSNIDQLVQIVKIMGTPSKQQIQGMNPNYEFEKFGLPKISKKPWKRVLRGFELENSFFDLLDNVMKYSPSERFTPLKAMTHPFFDEIKEEETYKNLKREYSIPDLFDFRNTKQVMPNDLRDLIPIWHYK